ncbi:hypothetical protein JCM10212_003650 [Sporobolomyces blumeae]
MSTSLHPASAQSIAPPVTAIPSTSSSASSSQQKVHPAPSYLAEIAHMVYVLTSIKNPNERILSSIQDVVRDQLLRWVVEARLVASRRHSKQIQPEDVLFPLRTDPAKLERVKTYLSWKDVRKKTKEPTNGQAGEDADEIDGIDEADKNLKVSTNSINLAWEFSDPWSDYLVHSSGASTSTPPPLDERSERDGSTSGPARGEGGGRRTSPDPIVVESEASRENHRLLREADEMTRRMTREEYEQYALARQASFVYRKGKKFRDFLQFDFSAQPATMAASLLASALPSYPPGASAGPTSLSASMTLSDEVLDVLGFLGYEVVRKVCMEGRRVGLERVERERAEERDRQRREREQEDARRRNEDEDATGEDKRKKPNRSSPRARTGPGPSSNAAFDDDPDSPHYPSVLRPAPPGPSAAPFVLKPIVSLFSAPLERSPSDASVPGPGQPLAASTPGTSSDGALSTKPPGDASTAPPPPPPPVPFVNLEVSDLIDGLWRCTSSATTLSQPSKISSSALNTAGGGGAGDQGAKRLSMGKGLRNWRGGVTREIPKVI